MEAIVQNILGYSQKRRLLELATIDTFFKDYNGIQLGCFRFSNVAIFVQRMKTQLENRYFHLQKELPTIGKIAFYHLVVTSKK